VICFLFAAKLFQCFNHLCGKAPISIDQELCKRILEHTCCTSLTDMIAGFSWWGRTTTHERRRKVHEIWWKEQLYMCVQKARVRICRMLSSDLLRTCQSILSSKESVLFQTQSSCTSKILLPSARILHDLY
jgi:hypothetical protein